MPILAVQLHKRLVSEAGVRGTIQFQLADAGNLRSLVLVLQVSTNPSYDVFPYLGGGRFTCNPCVFSFSAAEQSIERPNERLPEALLPTGQQSRSHHPPAAEKSYKDGGCIL